MENNRQTAGGIIVDETLDGARVDPQTLREGTAPSGASPSKRKSLKAAVAKPDVYIWGVYIMLLIISAIEVFSASSTRVVASNVYAPLIDHAKFLVAGFVIVLLLQKVHYKWFRYYATGLLVLSLAMLIYASIWGADLNDAKRAIKLFGGLTIQPPEIVKLTMVLFLAKVLAVNQRPGGVSNKGIAICVVTVGLVCCCLWFNGLTNALMVMLVSGCMFLIGGIEWRKMGVIAAIFIGLVAVIAVTKYSGEAEPDIEAVAVSATQGDDRSNTHLHRMSRFSEGVHPGDTITDQNRQVMFANFALANGGWRGLGMGNSRESSRLPLAYSDYIYSIIVEDTGFIGGTALLLLYLFLIARAGRIASKCRRAFPALLIMGCAVMIVLQALVHMVIVVGLGPVSGQPLPFISKGGTSILVMSAAIGMMLSVSRFAVTSNNRKDINAELKAIPEDLRAENPTMISK